MPKYQDLRTIKNITNTMRILFNLKEDIDLEAVIRGVVVPMLDDRKDADVISTSDAIHAHSNATYIQIHNEYKTAIEQQHATIELLVQKLLAEMQEKLKQDLQVWITYLFCFLITLLRNLRIRHFD